MRPEDLADEWERAAKDLAELPPVATALRCCASQLRSTLRWRPVSEPPTEPGRYEVFECGIVDFVYLDADESWWRLGNRLFSVTHWRPLPKGPT